jgi:hypothetical protein
MKVYTGIGSPNTPADVLVLMERTARALSASGWTLRTRDQRGADKAFLNGCHAGQLDHPRVEIYFPDPHGAHLQPTLERPTPAAFEIAMRYHSRWASIDRTSQARHARSVHEVLGCDCRREDAARMIVCWTPDGSLDGQSRAAGWTGMALRVAAGEPPGCEVFNLARQEHRDRIERFARSAGI